MKKRIISLFTISLISTTTHAASEHIIWDKGNRLLDKYNVSIQEKNGGLIQTLLTSKQPIYQLKPLDSENNLKTNDVRYQIYYKNVPVWGHELILHKVKNEDNFITGSDVSGIEKDVPQVEAKLSPEDIENKILANNKDTIIYKNIEKIIYLDSENKSHLAYQLGLYTNNPVTFVAAPNYIIDANSGEILKQWDDLDRKKIGQGLGGNVLILPYRKGLFQHGNAESDIPSLGKFDVTVKKGRCYVQSPEIKVINIAHTDMNRNSFPVLSVVEFLKKPPTFSYSCSEATRYINKNDSNSAPANYSFSSVNDTMYFAGVTIDMYREYYGVKNPLGYDLPLRAYTHIKNLDNAFAVPTIKLKGIYIIHQQIVIGDGDTELTAPAQGTLAHELSHNFTRLNSNLKKLEQSGAINEAFSDMASIAMQDYLTKEYPWYWDGKDWSIGREARINGNPIRYMDEPTMDGQSIDNALYYNDKMDIHLTCGIFNKAFFLIANKPGWSIRKAFQIMLDANQKYWTSTTHFEAAACGVIQAAKDRKYNRKDVVDAFGEVGVICPVKYLTD